jgi:FMN-dependent NADH-azoreductase
MKLLHLDSSILGEHSSSRQLTREIVARLQAEHAGLSVTYQDLSAEPLPHYSAASVTGADGRDAARDRATLEAFLDADIVVIGAPLYNFSLPSQLKAWIDRVTIKDRTFRYTAQGPQGLAGGKQVIVAIARGGVYAPGAGTEFGESYLRFLFGFLGITDLTFVRAEGLNVSPEQRATALSGARAMIGSLATRGTPTALAA